MAGHDNRLVSLFSCDDTKELREELREELIIKVKDKTESKKKENPSGEQSLLS